MSTKKDAKPDEAVVFGGVPRVDLMPPEVAQGRRDARTRRTLGSLVLLVLALTAAGAIVASWWAGQAQQRLTDARNETLRLQQERLAYSEVTQLQSRIDAIIDQRQALAAGEVLWQDTVDPLLGIVIADGGVAQQVQIVGSAPGAEPLGVTGPLRQPRVASVTLEVQTPELPDGPGWLRSLASNPMVADASIDSIVGDPEAGYSTRITINVGENAYSGRFIEEETE